jgi:hypothetical protein
MEQNTNKSAVFYAADAAVRGCAVAALLGVWVLGALASLLFGRLQRLGIGLADLAADGIDAVGGL